MAKQNREDLRLIAWRPDVAHRALKGARTAKRYVSGRLRQCTQGALGLYAAPRRAAPMLTQLLFGENFRVLDEKSGWAWGQCALDNYVGYLQASGLGRVHAPTHRLTARAAFVFARPDLRAPVRSCLSIGARLAVRRQLAGAPRRRFLHLRQGGYVAASAAEPLALPRADAPARRARFLEAAQQCLHMPYLWGGRGYGGADCSGLVMQALLAAGVDCPRDSDMQRAAFAASAGAPQKLAAPRAGDLAFWPGHVGIVAPARQLLHASAWHRRVAAEPWADACARLEAQTGAPAQLARPRF